METEDRPQRSKRAHIRMHTEVRIHNRAYRAAECSEQFWHKHFKSIHAYKPFWCGQTLFEKNIERMICMYVLSGDRVEAVEVVVNERTNTFKCVCRQTACLVHYRFRTQIFGWTQIEWNRCSAQSNLSCSCILSARKKKNVLNHNFRLYL